MTLPRLPYWTWYALEADKLDAELALGRTLEPYHLLILDRVMTPNGAGLAMRNANQLNEQREVVTVRPANSAVAGPTGKAPRRQRLRYEP